MTVWDVLRAGTRFWLVTLMGAVLTVVAGDYVTSRPGVYWGQVDVVFLTPQSDGVPNTFQATQTSAIAMAGIIQREVAGGQGVQVVSDDVTIVGQGKRYGSWVRLANSGGQWVNNFDRPVLDVQAVAATPAEVSHRIDDVVGRINAALQRRQDAARVTPSARFLTTNSPAFVVIRYDNGRRTMALAMSVVLGLGGTTSVLVLLEGRRLQRAPRRTGAAVAMVEVSRQGRA